MRDNFFFLSNFFLILKEIGTLTSIALNPVFEKLPHILTFFVKKTYYVFLRNSSKCFADLFNFLRKMLFYMKSNFFKIQKVFYDDKITLMYLVIQSLRHSYFSICSVYAAPNILNVCELDKSLRFVTLYLTNCCKYGKWNLYIMLGFSSFLWILTVYKLLA